MDIYETRAAVGRSGTPSHNNDSYSGGRIGNPSYKITGTHINYYFICHRKLWLFSHGVQMEQTSDTVLLGKLIDEASYERKDKAIDIDGNIVIDWIDLPASGQAGDKSGVLHEVKKSDSMEDAHKFQVLYYLWYLKQKGVAIANSRLQIADDKLGMADGVRGEIDYPKLKQKVEVVLTPEKEAELLEIVQRAEQVMSQEHPPERINKKFCKTCSYFELCWVNQ